MDATAIQPYIRPIVEKKTGFTLLAILAGFGSLYWLYFCVRLVTEGHILSGTASYGPVWGITVANIVHVIGISHVGIAISATVRVLKLQRYRSMARLAEFVTLVALMTAVLNIALDVGRPDRFIINTVLYGRWHAPMVWSMTVITLYLITSLAYLYLSMRRDFWVMSTLRPKYQKFYRLLAAGYEDTAEARDRHEHTLFWLAICLIPIMISVHSVYGLFFGLLPKPGWFNPLQAPYFVLGAIVSGFSAIVVIAAVLRWAYSWQELITDRIFKVFGIFLAFVVFLYLYFLITEQLTSQYAAAPAEKAVSSSMLTGEFSRIFWLATVGGLVIPFFYLFIQGVKKDYVNIPLTTAAAVLINVALWWKRYLIVVPAQYHAHFPPPRPIEPYQPTTTEIGVTFGAYAFAVLVFLVLLKWIPIIEMPVLGEPAPAVRRRASPRGTVMLLTLLAGTLLIAWGLATRQFDYAPVKWLIGMALIVAIPLEQCLIRDMPLTESQPT